MNPIRLHQSSPARRVLMGRGALSGLAAEVERAGAVRVVLVTSSTLRQETRLVRGVEEQLGGRHTATFSGLSEHTPDTAVAQLAELLEQTGADSVVSFGGGSVIDGCKAALHQLGGKEAVHVAVPTTLSGAEFTPTAGVTDTRENMKRGLRDPLAAPSRVILDPEVTSPTPMRLWLSSGIRALDHAVETLWAPERDPLTRHLAAEAIVRLREALPRCAVAPADLEARERAQVAAWWAALGLSSNTMGASHQLGRLLGASFRIPHGITSCAFLPSAIEEKVASGDEIDPGLPAAFGVSTTLEVGPACRALIGSLGLPTNLQSAGLTSERTARFLAAVPPQWRPIVERSALP